MPKYSSKVVIDEEPKFEDVRDWYDKNLHPDKLDEVEEDVYKNVYDEQRFPAIFQFTSCFHPNTQVTMSDLSTKSIIDIKHGDIIKSYDIENKKFIDTEVDGDAVCSGYDKVVKLKFDDGRVLICTYNHRFLTTEGYIEAYCLTKYDELILFGKYTKLKNKSYKTADCDVYDITVPETSNFIANGIVVHNSGAQAFIKNFKSRTPNDIAVATSIYRPGPLGAHVDKLYLDCLKDPKKIKYKHPLILEVLKDTAGCLVGDTLVMTENGEITIKEIVDNQLIGLSIPSFNTDSFEMEYDKIESAIYSGEKEVFEIELNNGKILELTGDHKVYTQRGWIETKEVNISDMLLHYLNFDVFAIRIKSIKKTNQIKKVYDIQVRSNHNFFANGLLVHNCIIFQESVMAIANRVGGFSLDDADKVRKALMKRTMTGKDAAAKKQEELGKQFIIGAISNGLSEFEAKEIWADMILYTGYGFNKSLHPCTKIKTYDSAGNYMQTKSIIEFVPGDYVKSKSEKTKKGVLTKVKKLHYHGKQEIVEVKLKTGETVKCTMNHKFRTIETNQMLPLWMILKKKLSIVCE